MREYKKDVAPYLNNFTKVIIPEDKITQIHNFCIEMAKIKLGESHYEYDNSQIYKRNYTGKLGEVALEILLNSSFVDFTVGDSKFYNQPDLSPLNLDIGIKTVEYSKYPLIFKNNQKPEIINLKMSRNEVLVCGVAMLSCLKQYQDDNLVLDPNLRRRGVKTGFYGFSKLSSFSSREDLEWIF